MMRPQLEQLAVGPRSEEHAVRWASAVGRHAGSVRRLRRVPHGHHIDNMPGSVIECLSCGLPVVTTNAGGVPYIVTHDETALIVPCDDHEALAAQAMRLLRDDDLAVRLARNGRSACVNSPGPPCVMHGSRRITSSGRRPRALRRPYRRSPRHASQLHTSLYVSHRFTSLASRLSDECVHRQTPPRSLGDAMKQVLRKGLKHIVVDDVPDPVPTAHHVLVRPVYSLISAGTETASIHKESLLSSVAENPSHLRKIYDAMKVAGPVRTVAEVQAKFSEYAALGYAGAGYVVDRHPTVTDLDVGARVAYGGEGTGHAETVLAGRLLVARIPDEVSFEEACFTTLGAIAMHGVRMAGLGVGDVVAVIGMGMIGQLVAQIARAQGAVVIALDLRPDRIALAERLGADHAFAPGDEAERRIAALTSGRGADCVIVAAAAKSSAPVDLALRLCRERGKVVVVGAVEMNLSRDLMYVKEIDVVVSRAYGPGSYDPGVREAGA